MLRRSHTPRWFVDTVMQGAHVGVITHVDANDHMQRRRFAWERGGAALLRTIDSLRARGASIDERTKIGIAPGPGTFSRIRLGVVFVNALAWSTGARVIGTRRHALARPVYGKPPSITVSVEKLKMKN